MRTKRIYAVLVAVLYLVCPMDGRAQGVTNPYINRYNDDARATTPPQRDEPRVEHTVPVPQEQQADITSHANHPRAYTSGWADGWASLAVLAFLGLMVYVVIYRRRISRNSNP